MANPKIFCNVPWTNLHVYWDGSFGGCCSESAPPYSPEDSEKYNLKNQTVVQWYNSNAMMDLRKRMLSNTLLPECSQCYYEETYGHESRRIKENFKSAIFTKQAFEESYLQSNWHERFESASQGANQDPPVDWHVDLGNECNLACKMCFPRASSKISAVYKKWGIPTPEIKNWVNNSASWDSFRLSLADVPINRLHFMGGEPTISKRFFQIINELVDGKRTDLSVSFVTNGTTFDQSLIEKLKLFRSADVEVSLEAFNETNDYIRQGSNWLNVVANLEKLIRQQTDTFRVILRSAPQLLSVNTYHEYIKWAWQNQVAIQSIPVSTPRYLQISVLPAGIRKQLLLVYQETKQYIQDNTDHTFKSMYTGRDPTRLHMSLSAECDTIIKLLQTPEPDDVEALRHQLAHWLRRWDSEYHLNALDYYPEYYEFLVGIGYATI